MKLNQEAAGPYPAGTKISLLVAQVLALVFLACNLRAPFGLNGLPTQPAVYCELMTQAWDEMGFQETLGMPMLMPSGDTVARRLPYLHHPPAAFWANYLGRHVLGKSEAGYRLVPLLATVLTSLLLWGLVLGVAGPWWALLAAVLFLLLPLIQLFGSLTNSEPYTLLLGIVLARLYLRWQQQPTRLRLAVLLAWFVLGCQVDWQFYFLAPGLWLAELLGSREERRLRPLLLLFPAGVLGFGLVLTHMWAAVGSWEVMSDQLSSAMLATQPALAQGLAEGTLPPFWESQASMLPQVFGLPFALLSLLALLACLFRPRWRRDTLSKLAVLFLTGGVCTVLVFNRQSTTHTYFWYLAAPVVPLLLIQAGRMLSAGSSGQPARRLPQALCALLLLAGAGFQLQSIWPTKQAFEQEGYQQVAAQLDAIIEARLGSSVCITSPEDVLRPVMLYSHLRWAPPGAWPEKIRELVAWRDQGQAPYQHVLVIVSEASRQRWPKLFRYLESSSRQRIPAGEALGFVL